MLKKKNRIFAQYFMPIAVFFNAGLAHAADLVAYGEAFEVPVFDRVDANGVDLVSGDLRIKSPVQTFGAPGQERVLGFEWMGRGWSFMDNPSIWRDGSKYYVNYNGRSVEFRSSSSGTTYTEQKPVMGNKLDCSIWLPEKLNSGCVFVDRYGDTIFFEGVETPYASPFPGYVQKAYRFGNLAMTLVRVFASDNGAYHSYGESASGPYYADGIFVINGNYYAQEVGVSGILTAYLRFITPNHSNDDDEHFLRPKNTTQTLQDTYGTQWKYTVNNDRLVTKIDLPGDFSDVNISYNSDKKVSSVTNSYGTWTYTYSSSNGIGTTTVRNPLNQTYYVKYNNSEKYVTEYSDELSRKTLYEYDTNLRLVRVTYPGQNYVTFLYDSRGNVTRKTTVASGGGGSQVEQAAFPATCSDPVTCNRPLYTIDANGGRTDYEYYPSQSRTEKFVGVNYTFQYGTGKPKKVTFPAPASGAPRPEMNFAYSGGLVARISECRTQSPCAGTSDEVVTTFDYGTMPRSEPLKSLFGMTITANGQSLTTCYGYDWNMRRISETPPSANIGTCPEGTVAAPPVNYTLPQNGTPASLPTFP